MIIDMNIFEDIGYIPSNKVYAGSHTWFSNIRVTMRKVFLIN